MSDFVRTPAVNRSPIPGRELYPIGNRAAVQYAGVPNKIQCINCGFRGCDTSRDAVCPNPACKSPNYRARRVSGF